MANRAPAALMVCLARLMRWAMVASGTRKALATWAVVRPPTARRVRATCEGGDSAGWQHRNSSVRVSSAAAGRSASAPGATHSSAGEAVATASSRRRRADSPRTWSVMRREATVTSQPRGRSGTPSAGHWTAAASNASWTASSHRSNWP